MIRSNFCRNWQAGRISYTLSTISPKVSFPFKFNNFSSQTPDRADFEEEIKKVTEGVDLIIDFIGKNYFTSNLNLLNRDGTLVFLAMMSGPKLEPDTNIMQILFKRLTLKGTTLRSRTVEYQADLLGRFEKHALGLIREGKMRVEVHEVFPWEKVGEAHKEMEANKNSGKVSFSLLVFAWIDVLTSCQIVFEVTE